ncbi:MAG: pyrroline-5-carboxylate reductase [Eubacterium sp.]|nr:pyrroline-5-carboxylate reductase [Eubacterium sp.]
MDKIGFIGMGNMGYALMNGCLDFFGQDDVLFFDTNNERCEEIKEKTGVNYVSSVNELVESVKYVVLAIKPQVYEVALDGVGEYVNDDTVIISLAPGITVEKVKELTSAEKIIRTMPNTPAMVNAGMTGICYDEEKFSPDEEIIIDKIFKSVGKYKKVDEELMNAVVCASGSSPAYVFMFIDYLSKACEKLGLSKEEATEFVAQTVYGSAKLLMETGEDANVLKERVCSPGGTTIEGVKKLDENELEKALDEATQACFKRCKELQ